MTGDDLRRLRKKTGLSRDRFAVLVLDVTPATVGRWERGDFQIDDLKAIGIKTKVEAYLAKQKRK